MASNTLITHFEELKHFTNYASKIVAIGGEEWIATFGSADEWADYDMYGVEHEE